MSAPLVTIGVVSFNRLYYLRALMESARECLRYPNVQWILVDGNSVEPGLREYVESLDFVQEKVFADCTHAEAMTEIVRRAEGDYLMILPEDVQFIVRGPWLADLVELVAANPQIGQVTFDVQRRATIASRFGRARLRLRGRELPLPWRRRYRRYRTLSGTEFLGYGRGILRTADPINGAGIMSFGRTEIWRSLGPWRTRGDHALEDSSLGAEEEMLRRYFRSGLDLERVLMRVGVAADVVTDPRGTKARIRLGTRRYGRYAPPPQGSVYYRLWDAGELLRFARIEPAPAFEDMVEPLGFELPLDANGNLLKTSVVNDQEPYELVGAS